MERKELSKLTGRTEKREKYIHMVLMLTCAHGIIAGGNTKYNNNGYCIHENDD